MNVRCRFKERVGDQRRRCKERVHPLDPLRCLQHSEVPEVVLERVDRSEGRARDLMAGKPPPPAPVLTLDLMRQALREEFQDIRKAASESRLETRLKAVETLARLAKALIDIEKHAPSVKDAEPVSWDLETVDPFKTGSIKTIDQYRLEGREF